jgi:alcohol sulfotransferase
MKDNRSKTQIRLEALVRLALWRYGSNIKGQLLLTEFPKSGGTWLGEMIKDYLEIPFPRNRAPIVGRSLLHGHNTFHPNYKDRVIALHRDGRDIMVSYYYHLFFTSEHSADFFVDEQKKKFGFSDFEDIKTNFPAFLTRMHEKPESSWRTTWGQFVLGYHDKPGIATLSYENLLQNPFDTLKPIVSQFSDKDFDAEKLNEVIVFHNFENTKKRMQAQAKAATVKSEKSFLRSGKAGGWKEIFNDESLAIFDHFNGEALVALGYEKDRNWFRNIKQNHE